MINPWTITGAVVGSAVLLTAGFWAGYEFRDGRAAQDELQTEEQSTEALLQQIEKLRSGAQEARQREVDALHRVEVLEGDNRALRANFSERVSRVEISDYCSLCRLGPDAAGVLIDAARGSVPNTDRGADRARSNPVRASGEVPD